MTRAGYVWDDPYGVTLRPDVLTFAAPRSRPNFNGFVFAHLPSGPPVEGAAVNALPATSDASAGAATTNFIGQFSIVGLPRATYTARITAAGFLPMLSFPQPLDQDTTLAAIAFTADSLAAWAAASGAAPPAPGFGHDRARRARRDRAALRSRAPRSRSRVGPGRSVPQTARALALRLDLPPGRYRVFARAPGYADAATQEDVRVAADEVTFGVMSLEAAPVAARRPGARTQRR